MTTRLRVVVDQLTAPVPGAVGRYTFDLTRSLIATSPTDCEVAGIVSSSPPSAPQSLPPLRTRAGMLASTITSLGTCRLVIPLSEFT